MEPSLAPMAAQLIDRGLLGVAVATFAFVIVYLWRDGKADREAFTKILNELHDKRLSDAKEGGAQMQAVVKESTATLAAVTTALDKHREATTDLRATLREHSEEVRELGDELRRTKSGK